MAQTSNVLDLSAHKRRLWFVPFVLAAALHLVGCRAPRWLLYSMFRIEVRRVR